MLLVGLETIFHAIRLGQGQPKSCPTWAPGELGRKRFPSHLFRGRWDRFSCGDFMTPFLKSSKGLSTVRKCPHRSQCCTTTRQLLCLHDQGYIWHLPPPQQQLPIMMMIHRRVGVYDSCSNGKPSSARPLAMLSMSADPSRRTTILRSAGSRAPFGSGALSADRSLA